VRNWFAKRKSADDPAQAEIVVTEEDEGLVKPFFEHLEDLRKTLMRILGCLFITFNVCLVFANRILFFLERPLYHILHTPGSFLQSLNVTDSFVLAMKLAFYGGLLLGAPPIFYYLAQFILPALKRHEKRLVLPVFVLGTLLFVAGAACCYFLMVPQTLRVFIKYSEWLQIEPKWTITSYVSFVTQFMLSVGLTFEAPLVLLILVRLGILSQRALRGGRKMMIAAAVVIAAILAPPDPLSMMLMALPLVVVFEITIWLAWFVERRQDKRR